MLFFLFSTDGSETKQRRNVGLISNLIALLELFKIQKSRYNEQVLILTFN